MSRVWCSARFCCFVICSTGLDSASSTRKTHSMRHQTIIVRELFTPPEWAGISGRRHQVSFSRLVDKEKFSPRSGRCAAALGCSFFLGHVVVSPRFTFSSRSGPFGRRLFMNLNRNYESIHIFRLRFGILHGAVLTRKRFFWLENCPIMLLHGYQIVCVSLIALLSSCLLLINLHSLNLFENL